MRKQRVCRGEEVRLIKGRASQPEDKWWGGWRRTDVVWNGGVQMGGSGYSVQVKGSGGRGRGEGAGM